MKQIRFVFLQENQTTLLEKVHFKTNFEIGDTLTFIVTIF